MTMMIRTEGENMASKKKKKTKIRRVVRVKTLASKAKVVKHRRCTVCRKLGHNKRSHGL